MTDKNIDKAKGRAKEAAGALTGDTHLKHEGRVDQAKSSIKNAVDSVADTIQAGVDRVTGDKKTKP
ncbi:MAG: CsbD family protein [Solirubrobacteraceae bacterium]